MTTRHTISHADELYVGNAFLDGYSPDGRRGLEMTHIYVKEYGAVALGVSNGIMAASAAPSDVIGTFAVGQNLLGASTSLTTGSLITTSAIATSLTATMLTLDVPRNIVYLTTHAANSKPLIVVGRDEYGQTMVEKITATSNDAYSSGFKAFKYIDKLYTTAACTVGMCIGTGNRIGLPFHLSSIGKFLGLTVDGYISASVGAGATAFTLSTGQDTTTVDTTAEDEVDVRGTINLLDTARVPNGTRVLSAMMVVDHTTRAKAFGPAPATVLT